MSDFILDDSKLFSLEALPEISPGDFIQRGGPGSGHHGHAGRPGEVGGSLPGYYYPDEHGPDWSQDAGVKKRVHRFFETSSFLNKVSLTEFDRGFVGPDGTLYQITRPDEISHMGLSQRAIEASGISQRAIRAKYGDHDRWVAYGAREIRKMGYVEAFIDRSGNAYELALRVQTPIPAAAMRAVQDLWTILPEDRRRLSVDVNAEEVLENGSIPRGQFMRDHMFIDDVRRVEALTGLKLRGGPGSGHHGHAGRPGEVGGSLPSGESHEEKLSRLRDKKYQVPAARMLREMYGDLENLYDYHIVSWIAPTGQLTGILADHQESAMEITEALGLNPRDDLEAVFLMKMMGFVRVSTFGDMLNFDLEEPLYGAQKRTIQDVVLAASDMRDIVFDVNRPEAGFGERDDTWWAHGPSNAFPRLGIIERGGPGSGHHGHKGRPGEVGGSVPAGAGGAEAGRPADGQDTADSLASVSPVEIADIQADLQLPTQRVEGTALGAAYTQQRWIEVAQGVIANAPQELQDRIAEVEKEIREGSQSIYEYYNPETGEWDEERLQLHQNIVEQVMEEAGDPPDLEEGERLQVWITGGLPGAGKSTVLRERGEEFPEGTIHVDSDRIKAMLPEYEGWNAALVHEESSMIVQEVFRRAIESGYNMVYDATLKTTESARRIVQEFHDNDYDVSLIYVDVPMEEAMSRALDRFERGGRYVSPMYIATHDSKNLATLSDLRDEVESWEHWDNSQPRGESPTLLRSSEEE